MVKTYKKILLILSALIVAVALSLGVVAVVKTVNDSAKTYESVSKQNIRYQDVMFQDDSTYYVVIWKEKCSACKKVEPYVVDYINDKNSLYNLYLLSSDKYDDELIAFDEEGQIINNPFVTKDNWDEFKINTVPMMIMVVNGEVVSYQRGFTEIVEQLKSR